MDGVRAVRTSFLTTVIACLAVLMYAAPASACRIARDQPPVSEAELKRQTDEGLVRYADAIVVAEVSRIRPVSEEQTDISFDVLSHVRGSWPVEIRPDEFIVTCNLSGNYGVYANANVGDHVLLFVVRGTVFHAEPIGTPREADLMSIITQGAQ